MKQNIGKTDRLLRLVLGLGILGVAAYWKCWISAIVGVILLFTAAVGWCGLYQIFGISTCKIKKP